MTEVPWRDAFLEDARENRIEISVWVVSGVELRGIVEDYDNHTVVVSSQKRPHTYIERQHIVSMAPYEKPATVPEYRRR